MNKIFRTKWNATLNTWQVTSELGAQSRKAKQRTLLRMAAGSLVLFCGAPLASPLPADGHIVAGQGQIAQHGADMTIHQSSQNMAINWQQFSIGKDNSVQFVQPNAKSAVLNRVTVIRYRKFAVNFLPMAGSFWLTPMGSFFPLPPKSMSERSSHRRWISARVILWRVTTSSPEIQRMR